ncbi:MAG: hypothetical protein ACOC2L_01370 [Candidatus Sumerlaeota bacterium]
MKRFSAKITILTILLVLLSVIASAQDTKFVWWEAENPSAKSEDLSTRHTFDARHEHLSEGVSIGTGPANENTFLEYKITVPEAGEWDFYVRKFWHHGPFRYRWNNGEWVEFNRSVLLENVKLDEHVISWMEVGTVELKKGENHLRLEAIPRLAAFAIDCFVLVQGPFTPRGSMKPGEKFNRAPEGWFSFDPDYDTFKDTPLDLSRFNEEVAGSKGKIVARDDKLVFEKTGEPVRFWGVTATSNVWKMSPERMDYLARRLAKMGVNMVRLHVAPYYETEPGPLTDGVHRFTAALRKEGIYYGVNWWCLAGARVQEGWDIEGLKAGDRPFSLHLFYEPLRDVYKQIGKTLLETVNPYTGMRLGDDPALAYVELIDEDNYFFYTFKPENMSEPVRAELERQFGAWASERYGSIEKALAVWGDEGPAPKSGDKPEEGRLALYASMYFGGQDWMEAGRNDPRCSDQLRFLVEDTREFNKGMKDFLREETGYDGIVVATNWKTTDERVVGPLDQYGNMAVDATARNTYFKGPSKNQKGFRTQVGDFYQDLSLLRNPDQALTRHIQQAQYPHFITEGGYSMSNRFRTEEQLVMTAYASLQGIDGLYPFVLEPDWVSTIPKWPIQTAATMGQYPAAALAYRMGYIDEGPVVFNDALALEDLFNFKGATMSQALGLDDYRIAEVPEGMQAEVDSLAGIDPLAFYVGRVVQTIGPEPGKSTLVADLPKHIDRQSKTIRSATGQVVLDFGKGLLKVDAPRFAGVAGFFDAFDSVQAGPLTVDVQFPYGSVMLVSLDGKPLENSESMLLQVMSEEKNYGYETEPAKVAFSKDGPEEDAKKVTDLGGPPLVVREMQGTITMDKAFEWNALDVNGYPTAQSGQDKSITLVPDVIYYHLMR